MATVIPGQIEVNQLLQSCHEELEALLSKDADIPPSMINDWAAIGQVLFAYRNSPLYDPDGNPKVLGDKLQALRDIIRLLKEFKLTYIEFLYAERLFGLNTFTDCVIGSAGFTKALKLFHFAVSTRPTIRSLKALRESAHSYEEFIRHSLPHEYKLLRSGKSTQSDYKVFLDGSDLILNEIVRVSNRVAAAAKASQRRQAIALCGEVTDRARAVAHLINEISGLTPSSEQQSEKEETSFVSSAEDKAIQRIQKGLTEDEWEVSYKPGDTVNISEIRNRQIAQVSDLVTQLKTQATPTESMPFWQQASPAERAAHLRAWVAQLPQTGITLPDAAFDRATIYE